MEGKRKYSSTQKICWLDLLLHTIGAVAFLNVQYSFFFVFTDAIKKNYPWFIGFVV